MESTGIYWKSAHAWLERAGFKCPVLNAHHVKNVPGHKSDISEPRWLAMLTRAGLLKPSFVPPEKLRFLRVVSRQRQKLVGMLAAKKNRLGKVLADAGIRLGVVVSDIHGKSARAMTAALIAGATPEEALQFASPRLKAPREDIAAALEGEISDEHAFVLAEIRSHIVFLEKSIARLDARLIATLDSPEEKNALALLQTVPGIDRIGAAMLLVEIGTNMALFAGSDRLASWAGMCPGNNRSAGKRNNERQRKGNPYVRRLLCEFVRAARKSPCAFRAKHRALAIRRRGLAPAYSIARRYGASAGGGAGAQVAELLEGPDAARGVAADAQGLIVDGAVAIGLLAQEHGPDDAPHLVGAGHDGALGAASARPRYTKADIKSG